MSQVGARATDVHQHAAALLEDPLYLDRCQVDTPDALVALAWQQVAVRRSQVGRVLDFGAGDARFAGHGTFSAYVGYEVDARRSPRIPLAENVSIERRCAFSHTAQDADVCIGNPPYVRNQDLPVGWRHMASREVRSRTGVNLSGLANAWQYFLMLALACCKTDGLVVQIVPYEWVSRPAAGPIREYILQNGWSVDVYRLPDGVFPGVLTAASITVIDKRVTSGRWRYFGLTVAGASEELPTMTGSRNGLLEYRAALDGAPRARRGLSPGTQKLLTLTEGERVHAGLRIGSDVVRCITTLRPHAVGVPALDADEFENTFRDGGMKCWLIRTDRDPSERLLAYLAQCDQGDYDTSTCRGRKVWWKFPMPTDVPALLVSQSFKGSAPKIVRNYAMVHAVGGVAGIYNVEDEDIDDLASALRDSRLNTQVLPYAKNMLKVEINQLNTLITSYFQHRDNARG